jgi:AraC-like DNA-binding protein
MQTVLKIIRDQLLPSTKQYGIERLITPASSWQSLSPGSEEPVHLSPHVLAMPRRPRGSRIVKKGPRVYSNLSVEIGRWPRDALTEWRVPALVFVTAGQADIRVYDYVLRCAQGHAVLLPTGAPHCDCRRGHAEKGDGVNAGGGDCELLWFAPQMMPNSMMGIWQCFTTKGQHEYYDRQGRRYEEYVLPCPRVVSYFVSLYEEITERKTGYEEICRSLMIALLRTVQRELETRNYIEFQHSGEHHNHNIDKDDPMAHAREYIAAHLSERLTIERVAHAVFMSRSLFIRRFQEATGKSFNEYLTQERLERAKNLLHETDCSVSYISGYVGIKPDRLRVLFRERLNTSPNRYRRLRAEDTSPHR